jgi:CBS domain-containing protein
MMTRDCPVLDTNLNLQTLVDDYLLKTGRRCFVVTDNGELVGLITPHEVKSIEQRLWPFKTASDAMRPLGDLHTVTPVTPVVEALNIIGRESINQLPVVDQRRFVGIISREQIVNYLITRKELAA